MTQKRKLDKVKIVKEMARERIGAMPAPKVRKDGRKKEKHKPDYREEME